MIAEKEGIVFTFNNISNSNKYLALHGTIPQRDSYLKRLSWTYDSVFAKRVLMHREKGEKGERGENRGNHYYS